MVDSFSYNPQRYYTGDKVSPAFVNMVASLAKVNMMKAQDEQRKIQQFNNLINISLKGVSERHQDQLQKEKEAFEKKAIKTYKESKGMPNYWQQKELTKAQEDILLKAQHSIYLKERYSEATKELFDNLKMADPVSFSNLSNWFEGKDVAGKPMTIENTPDPVTLLKFYKEDELKNWDFTKFRDSIPVPSTHTDSKEGTYANWDAIRKNVDLAFTGPEGRRNYLAGQIQGFWKDEKEAKDVMIQQIRSQTKTSDPNADKGGLEFNFNSGTGGNEETKYSFHKVVHEDIGNKAVGPGFSFGGTKPEFVIPGNRTFTPTSMYYNSDGTLMVSGRSIKPAETTSSKIVIKGKDIRGGKKFSWAGITNELIEDDKGQKFFIDKKGERINVTQDETTKDITFEISNQTSGSTKAENIPFDEISERMKTKYPGIDEAFYKLVPDKPVVTETQEVVIPDRYKKHIR